MISNLEKLRHEVDHLNRDKKDLQFMEVKLQMMSYHCPGFKDNTILKYAAIASTVLTVYTYCSRKQHLQ